jgi:hypothetical protein
MELKVSKDIPVIIPDDLESIPGAAKKVGRPYSSVYNRARRGDIIVHFIAGDTQAKVSLSEVRYVFKNVVGRRFSASTFRIVRHDEKPIPAPQEKADLFS